MLALTQRSHLIIYVFDQARKYAMRKSEHKSECERSISAQNFRYYSLIYTLCPAEDASRPPTQSQSIDLFDLLFPIYLYS